MQKLIFFATLFFSMVFVRSGMAAEAISILGDPCTAPLAKKLGDAFTKKTGTVVNVEAAACAAGIYKASNGLVDIGVSTRGSVELSPGWHRQYGHRQGAHGGAGSQEQPC